MAILGYGVAVLMIVLIGRKLFKGSKPKLKNNII